MSIKKFWDIWHHVTQHLWQQRVQSAELISSPVAESEFENDWGHLVSITVTRWHQRRRHKTLLTFPQCVYRECESYWMVYRLFHFGRTVITAYCLLLRPWPCTAPGCAGSSSHHGVSPPRRDTLTVGDITSWALDVGCHARENKCWKKTAIEHTVDPILILFPPVKWPFTVLASLPCWSIQ